MEENIHKKRESLTACKQNVRYACVWSNSGDHQVAINSKRAATIPKQKLVQLLELCQLNLLEKKLVTWVVK
jgi:hypothetical protein